jgi:hypothetical protein
MSDKGNDIESSDSDEFVVLDKPDATKEAKDAESREKLIDKYYNDNVGSWKDLIENYRNAPAEKLWFAVRDSPLKDARHFDPDVLKLFKTAPILPVSTGVFSNAYDFAGLDDVNVRKRFKNILSEMVSRKPQDTTESFVDPMTGKKAAKRISFLSGPLREANDKEYVPLLDSWEKQLLIARQQLRKRNPNATIQDAFDEISARTSKEADSKIKVRLEKRDTDTDTDPTNARRRKVQQIMKAKGLNLKICYGSPSSVMEELNKGTIELLINHLSLPCNTFNFRCPNFEDDEWMVFVEGKEIVGFLAIQRFPEGAYDIPVIGNVPVWNSSDDIVHSSISTADVTNIRQLLTKPTPESIKQVVDTATIPDSREDDTIFDADEVDITFASWRTGFDWIVPAFCFIFAYNNIPRNEFRFPVDLTIADDKSLQAISQFSYQCAIFKMYESANVGLSTMQRDIYASLQQALVDLKQVSDFSNMQDWHAPNPRGGKHKRQKNAITDGPRIDSACNPIVTSYFLMTGGRAEDEYLAYLSKAPIKKSASPQFPAISSEHLLFMKETAGIVFGNNRMLKQDERSAFYKKAKVISRLSMYAVQVDDVAAEKGYAKTVADAALWMLGTTLLSFAFPHKPTSVSLLDDDIFLRRMYSALPVFAPVFSSIHRCTGAMFFSKWGSVERKLTVDVIVDKKKFPLSAVAPKQQEPKVLVTKINKLVSAALTKIWLREELNSKIEPGNSWMKIDSQFNVTVQPPEPDGEVSIPTKKKAKKNSASVPVINPTVGVQPEIIEVRAPDPISDPAPAPAPEPKAPEPEEFVPSGPPKPIAVPKQKKRVTVTNTPILVGLDKEAIRIVNSVIHVESFDTESLPSELEYIKSTVDKAVADKRMTKRYRFINDKHDVAAYLVLVSTTYDAFAKQILETPGEGFQFCFVPTTKDKMQSSKPFSPDKGLTLDDPDIRTLKSAFKNVITSGYEQADFYQVTIHAANFKIFPLVAEFAAAVLPANRLAVVSLPVVQKNSLSYPWDVELLTKSGWALPYLIAYREDSFDTNTSRVLKSERGKDICTVAVKLVNRDISFLTSLAQSFSGEPFEATPGPFQVEPEKVGEEAVEKQKTPASTQKTPVLEPNSVSQKPSPSPVVPKSVMQTPTPKKGDGPSPQSRASDASKKGTPENAQTPKSGNPRRLIAIQSAESPSTSGSSKSATPKPITVDESPDTSVSSKRSPVPVTPISAGSDGPSPASAQALVAKRTKSPASSSSSYVIPDEPNTSPFKPKGRRGVPPDAEALDNLLSDVKSGKFTQPQPAATTAVVKGNTTMVPIPNTKLPAPMKVTYTANTPAALVATGLLTTNVPQPKRGRPSKGEKVVRMLLGLQATGVINVDMANLAM